MDRPEAVALVDRLHAALGAFYAGGAAEPVRALLSEEVEWHVPGYSAIAGEYYGIDAVLDYFRQRRDVARRTLRLHPGEILVGDEHLAVLTDGTATIHAREHRWSTVGLYRIREGRIAACWLLPLDAVAFDAVWSSAS